MMLRRWCLAALVATAAGCSMTPDYTRPAAPVSDAWPAGPAYKGDAAAAADRAVADIPWKEFYVDERLQRLIAHVRARTRQRNAGRVGTVHEVLVERPARRGGQMLGRTRSNLLVVLDLSADSIGDYRTVRLTATTGSTFTGAVVAPQLAVL